MKEIVLTKGYVTRVDDQDYDLLKTYPWHAAVSKNGKVVYAKRTVLLGNQACGFERTSIRMHQHILCWFGGIDHIDGDGLNNQRYNLRIATRSTNMQNRAAFGSSRFKGVSWQHGKWVARIMHNRKSIALGRFSSDIEAAQAYDSAARDIYGEHAYLNLTGA